MSMVLFLSVPSPNEIKDKIPQKTLYESGRIWFKHKIKMHSIFAFIYQEAINMKSKICNLLQRQVFSSANILKQGFCHKPTDLPTNTSNSALLGKIMV